MATSSSQQAPLPAAPALSKRESNKRDKLGRIKAAARELFIRCEYDEATIRQIAEQADVAMGTVFLYASNKRDLLFLVANDILDQAREEAAAAYDEALPLLENFALFAARHFQALGAEPRLARLVLRELLFYDSGTEALRAKENREQLIANIEHMVQRAHEKGEVQLPIAANEIAWIMFGMQQAEIRRWLAQPEQDLAEGIRRLWISVALLINGFANTPVKPKPHAASLRSLLNRLQ